MPFRHEVLSVFALCSSMIVREEALLLLHQNTFLSVSIPQERDIRDTQRSVRDFLQGAIGMSKEKK